MYNLCDGFQVVSDTGGSLVVSDQDSLIRLALFKGLFHSLGVGTPAEGKAERNRLGTVSGGNLEPPLAEITGDDHQNPVARGDDIDQGRFHTACAGSGYASHAEIVCVPKNLCVKIPEGVSFESAAFVALGGIALEAVRLAEVSLGEKVVVIGLGLLGQIAVQLCKAAGCHVFRVDLIARQF